jgi:hypothetical protein
MATDYGPHTAQEWAKCTGWLIGRAFYVSGNRKALLEEAKIDMMVKIIIFMTPHFNAIQEKERYAIRRSNVDRLDTPLDAEEHVDLEVLISGVMQFVQPFLNMCEKKETLPNVLGGGADMSFEEALFGTIKETLARNIRTAMEIERKWDRDRRDVA